MSLKTRKMLPAALVILVAALATVPALAAPDKTATFNADALEFKWTGGPHTSVEVPVTACGDPGVSCEYILFKLEVGGDLTVRIEPTTPADLDLYFYRSNAAGEPQGAALKSSAASPADSLPEEIKATGLGPGNYVAEVVFFASVQTEYDGVAKLTNPVAPPASNTPEATATATVAATPQRPTPTATPTPAPDHVVLQPPAARSSSKSKKSKKKQTARQKCLAKAKKVKNAKKRKAAQKRCTAKKKKKKSKKR